jgi:hypothetical protein
MKRRRTSMPLLKELGLICWSKSTNRSRLTPKAFGAVLLGFSTEPPLVYWASRLPPAPIRTSSAKNSATKNLSIDTPAF